jgi:hypothetical protein
MPTLEINITAINGSTGTYSRKSGPGTVESNGDITLNANSGANVDLAWTIASTISKTFKPSNAFTSKALKDKGSHTGEFTVKPNSNGNKTVTVTDSNDAGDGYEYSLTLLDGTVLDPKIINR